MAARLDFSADALFHVSIYLGVCLSYWCLELKVIVHVVGGTTEHEHCCGVRVSVECSTFGNSA